MTDKPPYQFEDREWGTDRPATERADKRSRKERPPRTALKPMRVGSGGNPVGTAIVIALAIATVIMCIIGLLDSMK